MIIVKWLNGQFLTNHEMGHLPFEAEITGLAKYGEKNRVTVAVDNTLVQTSVPQGRVEESEADNGTVKVQTYTFDFFNYAGIHRPVLLYSKPRVFVEDISVQTSLKAGEGLIEYQVVVGGLGGKESPSIQVTLLDAENQYTVGGPQFNRQGTIKVASPRLWWPRSMSDDPGYMYTLEVRTTTVLVGNAYISVKRLLSYFLPKDGETPFL